MNLLDTIKTERLYFDGGMGTLLQANGLKSGEEPASWSITHPDVITSLHKEYLDAGACGVGIGSGVVNKKAIEENDFATITKLAKAYTEQI